MNIPLCVANTFLHKAKSENIDITPMKLQKLIYIFYKEYLKGTKLKLFTEQFSVWKYGPVLPEVYNAFKCYGSNVITDYYSEDDDKYYTIDLKSSPTVESTFIDVWNRYKNYNGVYLSKLTHLPGTAWYKAREKRLPYLLDSDISEEVSYSEL